MQAYDDCTDIIYFGCIAFGDWICKLGRICSDEICCGLLFYKEDCTCGNFLWNIVSIPVRILLTIVAIIVFLFVMIIYTLASLLWLVLCVLFATFVGAPILIYQMPCPWKIVLILLYPAAIIYATAIIIGESYKKPKSAYD